MDAQQLILLVEGLIGHFFVGLLGIFIMLALKDYLMDVLKSYKWRKSNGLSEGDAIILEGHAGVVSAIKSSSISVVLYNGGLHLRVIDIDRVGSLDIQRVIVPDGTLHKHTGEM